MGTELKGSGAIFSSETSQSCNNSDYRCEIRTEYREFLSGFLGLMFRSGVSGVVSVNVSFASEAGGAAPRWLSNLGE